LHGLHHQNLGGEMAGIQQGNPASLSLTGLMVLAVAGQQQIGANP